VKLEHARSLFGGIAGKPREPKGPRTKG